MTKTRTHDVVATIRNTTVAFLFGMLCLLGYTLSAHAAGDVDIEAIQVDALEIQTDAIDQILNEMSGGLVLGAMATSGAPDRNTSERDKKKGKLNRHKYGSSTNATSSKEVRDKKGKHGSSTDEWEGGKHGSSTPARIRMLEQRIQNLTERIADLTAKKAAAEEQLAKLKDGKPTTTSNSGKLNLKNLMEKLEKKDSDNRGSKDSADVGQ